MAGTGVLESVSEHSGGSVLDDLQLALEAPGQLPPVSFAAKPAPIINKSHSARPTGRTECAEDTSQKDQLGSSQIRRLAQSRHSPLHFGNGPLKFQHGCQRTTVVEHESVLELRMQKPLARLWTSGMMILTSDEFCLYSLKFPPSLL